MSQLSCRNLSIGYDGKTIVSGIDFSVEHGDYLCIIGENGSGKTTLMKTILGLNPQLEGEITFGDRFDKSKIGYLPQQTHIQKDFPASVFEIVLSGCLTGLKKRLFYSKSDKQKALNALEKLQITELKNKSYRELSGGQQQRVLLARAICAANEMLLLDEPVAALDPKATMEFYKLLSELNKCEKITVVMISHNIDSAIKYASHILHIGSKQLFFGDVKSYIKSDAEECFCPKCREGK
ncbi:MAG: ABC transporter ATP-binding protein [Ruminococcaceae bacterium]|nr:ABC transporter ATP-binding protein [Oscillospiraceae bacterium]